MNPIRITPPPTCPHGAELNEYCPECEPMPARNLLNGGEPLRGLRRARVKAGLTQTEVGDIIDKTQAHYGKIENGAVELSARDALRLCRALDVSLEQIFE